MTSEREFSTEPICFCQGQTLPLRQLVVPAADVGLIHGVTVSEQVRTFRGRPFLLDRHYARWLRGLESLQLKPPVELASLGATIQRLLDHNARLLPSQAEQGICFFSTPGEANLGWNLPLRSGVSISIYTYPLPIDQHRQIYRSGVRLVSTSIRDVPADCWPRSVKIRSRLHYYLAQQQARSVCADAQPILLDHANFVSDSAIASIVGWTPTEGLIVRPAAQRYWSISVEFLIELAKRLRVPITERCFSLAELQGFAEAFLVSTPWCIYPVKQVDEVRLDKHSTGFQMFSEFCKAWESLVGCSVFTPQAGQSDE